MMLESYNNLIMQHVILIHGVPDKEEIYDPTIPSPSNNHWFPWLQKQLLMKDIVCQALEFPRAYDPVYADWLAIMSNCDINEETTLIGHSYGGGFLLRFLSENKDLKPKRVILVAPWLDPDKELSTFSFDFSIDTELVERTDMHMYISSDDDESIQRSCEKIYHVLPSITKHEYKNKGHFCTLEFPELLELL